MPKSDGRGRRRIPFPFHRRLGLAYVAALALFVGVEAVWYLNVTRLVGTLQWVGEHTRAVRVDGAPPSAPVDSAAEQVLQVRLSETKFAVTRTVAITALTFVLAVAVTGLAVLRTEREMDRRGHAEQKALEARDVAERMSRAKSDFLAHVSHELRTPLNSVIAFSKVLLRKASGRLETQETQYLERIRDNGLHLLSLIDDLLDLSKIEAGKQELELHSVALDRLIVETTGQFEGRLMGKAVVLRTELPPVIAPLMTDERKLKQVLINLIGNAVKFTDTGAITVRVATDRETGAAIRIDVADTGIGIPASRLDSIFEPFEQGDNSRTRQYEGTGLGLAIARSFCELLSYRLSVESEVGHGSVFSIHVPHGRNGMGPTDGGAGVQLQHASLV